MRRRQPKSQGKGFTGKDKDKRPWRTQGNIRIPESSPVREELYGMGSRKCAWARSHRASEGIAQSSTYFQGCTKLPESFEK